MCSGISATPIEARLAEFYLMAHASSAQKNGGAGRRKPVSGGSKEPPVSAHADGARRRNSVATFGRRGLLPSCPASPAGRSVQNAASFSARSGDPPRDCGSPRMPPSVNRQMAGYRGGVCADLAHERGHMRLFRRLFALLPARPVRPLGPAAQRGQDRRDPLPGERTGFHPRREPAALSRAQVAAHGLRVEPEPTGVPW